MNIWRLHIRPDYKVGSDPVALCLSQGVVGIGWGVDKKPKSKEEYLKLGEKKYGDLSWRKASNIVLSLMQIDDLVWFRDFSGTYYLARVRGDWKYKDAPENQQADLFNVRDAEIYKVGTSVAGRIINSFRASATVQRILGETVSSFSQIVYNRLCSHRFYKPKVKSQDIFDLLSDVDLEDVVGLYLQLKKNYIMVPSSRSRQNDTLFFEYQLVSKKNGEKAYVQVKSGNTTINLDNYVNFGEMFYLFSPAGYYGNGASNVVAILKGDILAFLKKEKKLMPISVKAWLDYPTM